MASSYAGTLPAARRAMIARAAVLAAVVGCNSHPHAPPQAQPGPAAKAELDSAVSAAVTDANQRIVTRQRAVKAWASVSVPGADAAPCASMPRLDLHVDGFQTGSHAAEKIAVIASADEIAGKPDSSLPPEVAKDLADIKRAGRSAPAPLGWSTIDYTTDEFPFEAGPRAQAFQYAIAELLQGGDTSLLAKGVAELHGEELILIVQERTRAEVAHGTFTAGSMAGVALLWSYERGAVICAGHFEASNTSGEFRGTRGQIENLPEEEVKVRAYSAAAASLRALPG